MAILEGLKKVVSEFLTEASDGRLAREVATFKAAPEAAKARAARATATTVWPLAEDPEVRLARRVCDEIAAQREAAEAHWRTLAPPPGVSSSNPALPGAQKLVEDCEAALKEAQAWRTAAENATRAWIHAKRRAGMQAIDTKLRAAVEPAYTLAVERQRYTEETTRLAELRDPDDKPHPFSALLGYGAALERAGTWWWEAPAPPVQVATRGRPGEMRVRFTFKEGIHLYDQQVHFPKDTAFLPKPVAEDLIKRWLAEPVGA